MQCAVAVSSAVNWLIYLPFLTFLLLVLVRSRVFDAWVLPLPYIVLILLAVGVALLHTIALRRAAAGRRAEVLADIDQKAVATHCMRSWYRRTSRMCQGGSDPLPRPRPTS